MQRGITKSNRLEANSSPIAEPSVKAVSLKRNKKINIPKVKYNGNCYSANAKHLLYEVKPSDAINYKVCHGVAINRADGKPYGHCWLEYKGMVIDKSNGLDVELPMEMYYDIGNIKKVYKYTADEVRNKLIEFEHWGAWDYDPPR